VSHDIHHKDPTNAKSIRLWSDPGILVELARHKAWLARSKLDELIEELSLSTAGPEIGRSLRAAIADVEALIHDIETLPQ
jgi:hypothetical protein